MIKKILLVAAASGVMALAGASCTVEVVDDLGNGGMGGMYTGGMGGTPATGGTGGTSATGGTGGEGGGGDCVSCSAYITECNTNGCPDNPDYCAGSEDLADAFTSCICGECTAECKDTCDLGGEDEATCVGCLQTASNAECKTETGACFADI
jgi:hypothetical protein